MASATRGVVLPGDVDGVPGVVLPGEAGVEGVADDGVDGEDDSTGVVDVGSAAGFASLGAVLLPGTLEVPGVADDGELLSGAPG